MTLTRADVEKIIEVCGDDGHSLYAPAALDGVNPDFVASVTTTHESDRSSPKSTIIGSDGKIIYRTTAVYTLTVLGAACMALDLKAASAFGRGTQARHYTDALRGWLKGQS